MTSRVWPPARAITGQQPAPINALEGETELKINLKKTAVGVFAVAALSVGVAVTAGAVTQPKAATAVAGYHACVDPTTSVPNGGAIYPNDADHELACYGGRQLLNWPSMSNLNSIKADLQAQINAKVGVVTGTGTTHVSHWPENGSPSWAVDDFNRTVTLTRGATVEASKCGAGAATCYLYTGSLADNGSFLANDGAPTPASGDGAATISGVVSGSLNGVATVQLYADGAPTVTLPASQDGKAASGPFSSTTGWAEALFPAGTHFGDVQLSAYDWSYKSTCETWTEHYVATSGPEQQTGNITHACTS